MKKTFSLIIASIIGGLVVFFSMTQIVPHNLSQQINDQSLVQLANHKINAKPEALAPLDFKAPAKKAMPVVVHISAAESQDLAKKRKQKRNDPFEDFFRDSPFNGQKRGTGSGVIISRDGYIVTNNHVVEFADEVEVTLYNNKQYKATIVGTDLETDMAVLKIEASGLPVLAYGDSDKAEVGEWVLAVGNPFDLTSTVTAGIISAKGRDINLIGGNRAIEAFIQTDAAVNPGNSGGALVNAQGELIGINTAIATQTGSFSGYSFAIPINIVEKIVDDIIKYGSFQRAFLGINISPMDNALAKELGLNITQGVFIESVMDGGAAQYAGLLPNDVITNVNKLNVKSVPELQEIIGRAKVGDTIKVTVNRKGKLKEIPVKLKRG